MKKSLPHTYCLVSLILKHIKSRILFHYDKLQFSTFSFDIILNYYLIISKSTLVKCKQRGFLAGRVRVPNIIKIKGFKRQSLGSENSITEEGGVKTKN